VVIGAVLEVAGYVVRSVAIKNLASIVRIAVLSLVYCSFSIFFF
jgi:hypothetical protein